ncbi:ELAV-like protein 2 [Schistosoma japonicum]|nr:ELAV-like protein 2 [Schistosoma japonicum]
MVVYHDRNLIINYIPTSITDADLTNLFSSVGTIKTCRIIRDRNSGSSFGFGFCEYEDSCSAHKAITRFNGYRIADKVLKVSLAKLQGRLCQSSNLYVKNFPPTLTEDDLAAEFGQFGRVIQCRILRDHDTNVSKGSAYVLFENSVDAEAAKRSLDAHIWPGSSDNQTLSIKFTTPPYRQSANSTKSKNNFRRPFVQQQHLGNDCFNGQLSTHLSSHTKTSVSDVYTPSCPQLPYMSNNLCAALAQSVQGSLLQSPTVQPQINPQNLLWSGDYPNNEYQNPVPALTVASGYLTPYFYPQQPYPNLWLPLQQNYLNQIPLNTLCTNQLESYGNSVQGCPIFTKVQNTFYPTPNQPKANLPTKVSDPICKQTNESPYFGRPKSTKIDKGESTSVYIYNIGNMTEAQMFVLFSQFGPVLNVSIPRDYKTNSSRNFGFVTFSNFQSAQNAIDVMNGSVLSGRRLQVSFRQSKGKWIKFGNPSNGSTLEKPVSKQNGDVLDSGCHSPQLSSEKLDVTNVLPSTNLQVSETVETLANLNIANGNNIAASKI